MELFGLDSSYIKNEDVQPTYNGFSDWFVKINDPVELWRRQPTYILSQIAFLIGGLITLIHAFKNSRRFPYLWLATLLHGVVVEALCYNFEDIDNFWHSQTPIIFLGRRLPLHIITLYPVFIYHASVAVSKMKLPTWAEPFAVGLVVVLIDIPYDIVSVKFVHWTWHDTDPNIADRHYWVPWNSYYFHACFAASFTFWFHGWHRWITKRNKWESSGFLKEVLCAVLTGLLGMPGGVLLFLPLYHPLHDLAKVHSEVTFMMLFTVFLLIVWSADRVPKSSSHGADYATKGKSLLVSHLMAHYLLFFGITVFGKPENEVSTGVHETIGPCNETSSLQTAFGIVLQKRKYLCISDYNEDYFGFECVQNKEILKDGTSWYTICGKPFENRIEYIAVIGTICLIAWAVFYNLHYVKIVRDITKKKNK